jgi:hypothetical protein
MARENRADRLKPPAISDAGPAGTGGTDGAEIYADRGKTRSHRRDLFKRGLRFRGWPIGLCFEEYRPRTGHIVLCQFGARHRRHILHRRWEEDHASLSTQPDGWRVDHGRALSQRARRPLGRTGNQQRYQRPNDQDPVLHTLGPFRQLRTSACEEHHAESRRQSNRQCDPHHRRRVGQPCPEARSRKQGARWLNRVRINAGGFAERHGEPLP